jgi:hypothetical protein
MSTSTAPKFVQLAVVHLPTSTLLHDVRVDDDGDAEADDDDGKQRRRRNDDTVKAGTISLMS